MPTGSGVSGNLVTDGNGNSTVYLETGTVADVLNAIDLATGVKTTTNAAGAATLATASGATASSIAASGALQISTGTTADLSISGTGNSLAALGLNGNTGTATSFTASRSAGAGSISGKTLTFTSFNSGTAVNVTFGDGTGGTVKTLDQLNTALQANNLTATVDTTGKLTISASNDYASSTLGGTNGGAIGGTLTSTLTFTTAAAPVADATSLIDPFGPGIAVQQHPEPDHDHRAGCFVQRREPAERRYAQAGVQREEHFDAQHHWRELHGVRP